MGGGEAIGHCAEQAINRFLAECVKEPPPLWFQAIADVILSTSERKSRLAWKQGKFPGIPITAVPMI